MKRNRESKYRQKTINCLHKNKSQQRELDILIPKYHIAYFEMYQFAVKHDFYQSKDMIEKMIECEMGEVFKTFGDMSELPLDLFEHSNPFGIDKRPYYLGVDFARGSDRTGIVILNKENT